MRDFAEMAAAVRPSVVLVRLEGGGGAGVVVAKRAGQRVIVTNAHVARASRGDRVSVVTSRGTRLEGLVQSRLGERDLAVLVPVGRHPELVPIRIGDTRALDPGQLVMAIGHPLGVAHALTTGVVHAVGPVQGAGAGLPEAVRRLRWIQADVRLAPGNSGGPLCDIEGRLIGINTMVIGGLALAVPVEAIEAPVHERRRARLGVTVSPVAVARGATGLAIQAVSADGPGARAGLTPGDVLLAIQGQPLATGDDLVAALGAEVGEQVTLDLLHDGRFERRRLRVNS